LPALEPELACIIEPVVPPLLVLDLPAAPAPLPALAVLGPWLIEVVPAVVPEVEGVVPVPLPPVVLPFITDGLLSPPQWTAVRRQSAANASRSRPMITILAKGFG
jgi:hypothetical protein